MVDTNPLAVEPLLTERSPATVGASGKRPGRPQTRTQVYYKNLLEQHADLARWFSATFGRPPKTDVELLKSHFEAECTRLGARSARINSDAIQGRIKTLRNQLSEARRTVCTRPEKPPVSGMA